MEPFLQHYESILLISDWMSRNSTSKLTVGFTTKYGGVSEPPFESLNLGFHTPDNYENVLRNRELLASKLTFPLDTWVMGEQVHSNKIAIVTEADKGKGAKTNTSALSGYDGLITNQKEILCTALFADCVPLFFNDSNSNWIGIAHAGWRGTVQGIAKEMISKLTLQGVRIQDLKVAVGPCISQESYEVDDNVIKHISKEYYSSVVTEKDNNRYMLDLKELNKQICLQAGIQEINILVTNYCTYHDKQFFSHRRDQGKTGRMLGFIGFRE